LFYYELPLKIVFKYRISGFIDIKKYYVGAASSRDQIVLIGTYRDWKLLPLHQKLLKLTEKLNFLYPALGA